MVYIYKSVKNGFRCVQLPEVSMLFAVDIGNTHIVTGGISDNGIDFVARLSTDVKKTDIEYALDFQNILSLYHIEMDVVEGCIISSVVPLITDAIKKAAEHLFGISAMVVKPGLKTGLNICMDNAAEMGADRVADAVAAIAEYPIPLAIVDMDTATTISVIDSKKRVIGGSMCPGVRISLDALTTHASKLSEISLETPKSVIGRNTADCMRSGILYGNAAAIDGILDRMEEELGEKLNVVATGRMSSLIVPYCRREIRVDETLLLKGLKRIYEKNTVK